MTETYADQSAKLAGVAERMAALADRLDRGARLVTEGSAGSGRVSVVIDRAGLAETVRVRADWRTVVAPDGLPLTISDAYLHALGDRLSAALDPTLERFATGDDPAGERAGVTARLSATVVPRDQLARSLDRLSADAWQQLEALQQQAGTARSAPPTGVGTGAAGRVVVRVGLDLRLECRIDAQWAGVQSGAGLMNTVNPALHAARDDLAGVSDEVRFPVSGSDCSDLLDDFLALLNDPHRFADELAGRT